MTPPRGLLGSGRGGQRPPQLGPYNCGDLKGPPALRRSEKEGGRRPPEPSHIHIYIYTYYIYIHIHICTYMSVYKVSPLKLYVYATFYVPPLSQHPPPGTHHLHPPGIYLPHPGRLGNIPGSNNISIQTFSNNNVPHDLSVSTVPAPPLEFLHHPCSVYKIFNNRDFRVYGV